MNRGRIRKRKRKCRAHSRLAIDADVALHQSEIFLDDVEAQTEAIKMARVGFFQLVEFLKDLVEILFLNPDAGVGYGKFDALFVFKMWKRITPR